MKEVVVGFSLFEVVEGLPTIDIVDIGASPIDGKPPYQQLIELGKANVVGFEPNPEQFAQLVDLQTSQIRFLPYAVGDGEEHILHLCRAAGMCSLLEPDMEILEHFHGFPEWGRVIDRKEIATRRLDDIAEIEGIDYLKLDVQGSELSILQNAGDRLKHTLVIHLEVQFIPFYKDQPMFAELDQLLRREGYYLHTFTPLVSRVLKPLMANNDPYAGLNQVLWSDAVYVKKFTAFSQLSTVSLLKIAAIAHDLYNSFDLCLLALQHVDNKEGSELKKAYLERLTGK